MRTVILALLTLLAGTTAAPAQGWAQKMFKEGTSHDFGVVPHGAQLFHRFTITNIYAVRMEITGIHPGCGCVTAAASTRVLEPRESAALDVRMDAKIFTGPKTVAIRITVGPEFTSSAELKVSATSRTDVVFNPGQINFGTVTPGQSPSQTIDVEYAGQQNWQVTEVLAKDLPLDVTFKELYRKPGQVGYQVKATLKADAPVGTLKQDVFLKTNDPASPLLAVLVEANVQTTLSVYPPALNLGSVKVGEALTRRVVVRGNKPFRILGVEGVGDGIGLENELTATAASQTLVTFKCQFTQPGDFKRELKIKTDLQESPVVTVKLEGKAE